MTSRSTHFFGRIKRALSGSDSDLPILDAGAPFPGGFPASEEDTSEKASPSDSSPIDRGPPLPTHAPTDDDKDERNVPHDYDERATQFWSVYVEEAESHDQALIETWKDDMEGVIIFAGLYSASLTAFLVESYHNLKPEPGEQTVFLLQQSIALLLQISRQLGPEGAQVPIIPPEALPEFHPSLSDVRVNVFWFMSLIFSLTAALAATIIQSWVRDYMHVFQRYNHPLKRARIRQFLYEGAERWKMPVIVDGIPALIHISLFLFFVGLSDFLFDINLTTAITTTAIISISGILYFWSIIAPVVDAQSPYQSPLSGICWLIFQTLIRRRMYRDNGTQGERTLVSGNMMEGRTQLAMDESEDRKKRDAQAIRWALEYLTEDSEVEPFVLGISGSLDSRWGTDVWSTVAQNSQNNMPSPRARTGSQVSANEKISASHPSFPLHRNDAIGNLKVRSVRLWKTCADPGLLVDKARRTRARACVDATLSLVLAKVGSNMENWLSEPDVIAHALTYLGEVENIEKAPPTAFDGIFAMRWTCLTLLTVREILRTPPIKEAAQRVIEHLAEARGEEGGQDDEVSVRTASIIDKYVTNAWKAARGFLKHLEGDGEMTEERFGRIVDDSREDVAELLYSWNLLGWAEQADEATIDLAQTIMHATAGVLAYLPGAAIKWPEEKRHVPDTGLRAVPTWLMPHFIPPRLLTQRLCVGAWALRDISASASPSRLEKLFDPNSPDLSLPELKRLMDPTDASPFKTQVWRLQDLRDGAVVYTLELLIDAIRSKKLSSHPSAEELYTKAIRAITRDWRDSSGARNLLVAVLRDILPKSEESKQAAADTVPTFVINEILVLVGNACAGTSGRLVREAVSLIKEYAKGLQGEDGEAAKKTLQQLDPNGGGSLPR